MASTVLAETPAFSKADSALFAAMLEVYSSGAAMRRSLMPVRVVIHSSVVSTNFSKSKLVSLFRKVAAKGAYGSYIFISHSARQYSIK